MDERAFYNEKEETRKVKLICPSCRGEFEAPVRWKVSRKKKNSPAAPAKKTAASLPKPVPSWSAWMISSLATNAANASSSPANPPSSSTIISATPTKIPKISAIGRRALRDG